MDFQLKDVAAMAQEFKSYIDDGKRIEPAPTGVSFLDQRFDKMRDPDGNVAPYYRFFYALAKKYKPKTVVELGGWQGTSAAHFAAGCPESLVITIDHHTDPGDDLNIAKMIQALSQFPNLTYCQGWTCDEIYNEEKGEHALGEGQNAFPKVVKELDGKGIDILFIDSWHEYNQAKRDWEAYKPLLASPALVICDDIYKGNPGEGIDNMVKFWDEMPGEKVLDGQIHPGYPMGLVKI